MSNFKLFAFKIFFLIILLIFLNYLYKFTFYEKDIQKYSEVINLVRKVVSEKDEIVYIGESSNITTRADDIDKRSISDFIIDYYPTKKFGSITKDATHAGIMYELLRNIPEKSSIKTVIVTLNLRTFDANCIYSYLETSLQKSIVLLKNYPPLFNRLLLSFKGYDIKSEAEREKQYKDKWKNDTIKLPYPFEYLNVLEWDQAKEGIGIRNSDGSLNYPQTALACNYIKTYAFQIDTLTNQRIKDFDKIVILAKERHWNLILNLMAENVEKANSLVGKDLIFLIMQNKDLLIKRYNKNGVKVVNNLEILSNNDFIDQNWTTEHYAENGRKMIAKNVADCLKKIYHGDYVAYSNKLTKSFKFFNNCEGNIIWGQMQTLTSEKSFSGEKSSKTGQKQDFSITFEYGVKNLPDSLKQVSIDLHLFQNDINHNAKLVIEIEGNKINYSWNGFLIKDLSKITGKWDKINFNFNLPENFYDSDIIKIYIYNPTNSIIYVDDFNIIFKI